MPGGERKCQQNVIDVKPEACREEYGGGYLLLSGVIRKTAGGNSNALTKGGSIKTHKEGDISMRENILSQGMEIEKHRCVEEQQTVSSS